MTAPVFPQIQDNAISYVAGLWQGYGEAIQTQAKGPSQTIKDMGSNWQGQRANLFGAWWGPVTDDLATVVQVTQVVYEAFRRFAGEVPAINALFDKASALVLANCKLLHDTTWGYDQGKTSGSGAPEGFQIVINGPTVTKMGGEYAPTPAWYTQLTSKLEQAHTEFERAATALGAAIAPAAGKLKQLVQLKEITKGGGWLGSESPSASLGDPTWKMLTGGGVFRPTAPPGFKEDPFGNKGVPSWYDPSLIDKVLGFVGDHLGDLINGASLIAALAGVPELALTIETAGGVVSTVKDAATGDYGGVALDAIGLLVDVNWKSESVNEFLSDYKLGDKFGEAVAASLEQSEEDISPTIAAHFGDYVQDHVEDYIKEQVTAKIKGGDDSGGQVTVPASVLNQIYAQAAQQAGVSSVAAAAG